MRVLLKLHRKRHRKKVCFFLFEKLFHIIKKEKKSITNLKYVYRQNNLIFLCSCTKLKGTVIRNNLYSFHFKLFFSTCLKKNSRFTTTKTKSKKKYVI